MKKINLIFAIFIVAVILIIPTTIFAAVTDLQGLATQIQTTVTAIATPLVIIGWLIAGILWLTSAGSPEKLGIAKKAAIAAVIGTVFVALAIGSASVLGLIKAALGVA